MYKTEKEKAAAAVAAVFDPEKVRKQNRKALQKLIKVNSELENAKLRRRRYQNRTRLEKDEKEFFEESERRLFKLNLESDTWIYENDKLENLCKRRDLLFDVMKNTNEQLLEAPVMKSLRRAAQQQQERLTFLNKELKKNVAILSRQLVHQTKLFDEFTEKERESNEMMALQDSYFKEIRQKLKLYDLVTVKEKVAAEQEEVEEEVRKNEKLVNMIKTLRQQAINVPMLKYQFLCAVDEKRRLSALNKELETVIQILTDRLSDQTSWEVAYKDMEKKIRDLEKTENDYLSKLYEVRAKTKIGTKRRLSAFKIERKKDAKMDKRLNYFKSKINDLLKEYKAFQPEIEKFLGDLIPPFDVEKSPHPLLRGSLAEDLNSTENTPVVRKPEKFSDDSSSEIDYNHSLSEESTDSTEKRPQTPVRGTPIRRAFNSEDESTESTDSSQNRDSLCPTADETSEVKTSTEDSTDCCEDSEDALKIRSSSKARCSKARGESEDSDNDNKYKRKANFRRTKDKVKGKNKLKEGWWKYFS